MCGIYGIKGNGYNLASNTFGEYLKHRGPDDSGIYIDENIKLMLGHTRLSIIDLSSSGHQPITSDDGKLTLVFNGEIYNYKELRSELIARGYKFRTETDSEVVLNSYIEWNYEALSKFRGMFSFCVQDHINDKLFLARDRFGIKPLIYSFLGENFTFASELKPFLSSPFFNSKLDLDAVNDFYRFGTILQPRTILDRVSYLMPGHYMEVCNDLSYKINKYYDLVKESKKYTKVNTYDDAIVNVRDMLKEATEYHMVSDVPVGAFLSGGIDSTAIVAMMQQISDSPINTFSIGFRGNVGVEDETDIAARTAKMLGCNHKSILIDDDYVKNIIGDFVSSLDQPSIDGINTFIVSKEAAKDVKVALSGLGGDELFAGYSHFRRISNNSQTKPTIWSSLNSIVHQYLPNRFTKKLFDVGLEEEKSLQVIRTLNHNTGFLLNRKVASIPLIRPDLSSLQRISLAEINGYMLNTLIRDNDVLSMASSIEVRPIFLDHVLMERVFGMQDEYKIRNDKILKSVLIDSVKDIIPAEVWQRKKTGFEMPFVYWMNGVLNNRYKELMCSPFLKQLFTKRYISSLSKRVNRKSLTHKDWATYILLSWLSEYEVSI